jgi:hypothetical protein
MLQHPRIQVLVSYLRRMPTRAEITAARRAAHRLAQDLAASVEVLSAAIEAIPADRLNPWEAQRLIASLDASFEALRQIRRYVRRTI